MKSPCDRYLQLTEETRDRTLSAGEVSFVENHRQSCADCARVAADGAFALDLLRELAVPEEAPEDSHFQRRVARRWKVESIQSRVRYWTPVMLGAVMSLLAVLAGLQMLTADRTPRTVKPFGEARRTEALPKFPTERTQTLP